MMSATTERLMRRWQEQRWILDAIVQTNGVEWDQPRLGYTLFPCGPDAASDFRSVGMRVRKFNDIDREFARAAGRREAMAARFEKEGRFESAGECYFIASLLWSAARWPIFENNDKLIGYNDRMKNCFMKFIVYAPHPVESVEVPFEGHSLPGYLHLPRKPKKGERFPCVISIDGMDGSKEMMCSMHGDKFLMRGMANFAFDGPGQGECCIRNLFVTPTNHQDSTRAVYEWLVRHPHIDSSRIVLQGVSFGSYFGMQGAWALGHQIKGAALSFVCHEPGGNTLFNQAAPSFKLRFMYMAGISEEAVFDKWVEGFDLRSIAREVKCPVLIQAGEDDELSPIEYTYELFDMLTCPKRLVVYEGERHAIGGAMAGQLGEPWFPMLVDWLRDRAEGRTMKSEKVFIDMLGRAHANPVSDPKAKSTSKPKTSKRSGPKPKASK
jgi:cephalosporin-C deacetylase-like acetyl esterase